MIGFICSLKEKTHNLENYTINPSPISHKFPNDFPINSPISSQLAP